MLGSELESAIALATTESDVLTPPREFLLEG